VGDSDGLRTILYRPLPEQNSRFMDNLFTIRCGEIAINAILNRMCRRSYQYVLGREFLKNPTTIMQFILAHPVLLLHYGYVEHCQVIGVQPQYSEEELTELITKHNKDPKTIADLQAYAMRYAELEETDPTVINDVFE